MRFVAKVSLEFGDIEGRNNSQKIVKEVGIDVVEGEDGVPMLTLAMRPKDLAVPIKPPVCMYTHRIPNGQLGMRFPHFKHYSWEKIERTLQVTLNTNDIDSLTGLAQLLDKILIGGRNKASGARTHRKPLLSRCLNSSPLGSVGTGIGKPCVAHVKEELPSLTDEQQRALDIIISGKSIFFTGCAGTGKSLLLLHIIRALPSETTFVTGLTGLAGSLLGGTTLNSWAGIGRGEGNLEGIIKNASRGEAGLRWRKATTLIIDEVSMMDGAMFDLLELIARRVRGNNRPFGGIQLVLSGDFHQLPPVVKDVSSRKFAFEAAAWGRCIQASVQLTKVFRQNNSYFINILSKIRCGSIPESELRALLSRCSGPIDLDDGILATKLFTHRADVDAINSRELASLPGSAKIFSSQDSGNELVLQASCPAPKTLQLKVGAQVMVTRNISARKGLVNGARGVVERFTPSGLPVVKFARGGESITISTERYSIRQGGQDVAVRLQLPLALAWAVTVHKSQGLTLDRVEVSLERAFEQGMAYVALSRARSLEGLRIVGSIASTALKPDPKVVAFYQKLQNEH